MKCRNCKNLIEQEFVDLYTSPPSNSFLSSAELSKEEIYYPLNVLVCQECLLVQIDEFKKTSDIFNEDYVYFSSFSTSWLKHAERYTSEMIERFSLSEENFIVEVASNDGYLLKNFVQAGIPCLGVEPTLGTAKAAQSIGVETMVDFFGVSSARIIVEKYGKADLALGNNVLAHVPDLHDFLQGFKILLKKDGVVTFEFPHLMQLIENNQFDTIYHEHYSYLSLISVKDIFARNGLKVFDVEQIPTHGGSLRVYGCHVESTREVVGNVDALEEIEISKGMDRLNYYQNFSKKVELIKVGVLTFLLEAKKSGEKVAAYGAAAKGNTLLNYCGIKSDLITCVADASPHKQNKFLPGSRIPVVSLDELKKFEPDYVLILPWNLKDEIHDDLIMKGFKNKFVTFVPETKIF
jgi:hypothetical protein